MGVNICVYELGEKEIVDDCAGQPYSYIPTKEFRDWDSCRHTGDRDFALTSDLEWESIEEDQDRHYYRPKDFEAATNWVKNKIEHKGNHDRFFRIFEAMKTQPNLYFYFSW